MKLAGRAKYSQLFIPNRPMVRQCEQCKEERAFRLLMHCELTHVLYVLQWGFSETPYRACTECGRAYPMTTAEMREFFPHYVPLASRQRRRLVFAVIWIPVILYILWWNVGKWVK